MIQRIQTIWLLLASACLLASLKISFYAGNVVPAGEVGSANKTFTQLNGMHNIITNVLTVSIGVLSFVAIFLYTNRKIQIRTILVTIFLELLLMFEYETCIKEFAEGSYTIGSFLQLLAMLFFILALRGIRKDQKIVAESDRLR
jgi:hypothetical protein